MLNKMITFKDGIYKNLVGYVTEIDGGIATVYLINEDREVKEIVSYMELVPANELSEMWLEGFFVQYEDSEKYFYELYVLRNIEAYAIKKFTVPDGIWIKEDTLFYQMDIDAIKELEGLKQ